MQLNLSKLDISVIKGIAILAMLFHHMYGAPPPNVLPYSGVHDSVAYVSCYSSLEWNQNRWLSFMCYRSVYNYHYSKSKIHKCCTCVLWKTLHQYLYDTYFPKLVLVQGVLAY